MYKVCTYSTCFDHSGGSLKVMNIQLVKIVHIMIMLKRVRKQLREKHGNGDYIYLPITILFIEYSHSTHTTAPIEYYVFTRG